MLDLNEIKECYEKSNYPRSISMLADELNVTEKEVLSTIVKYPLLFRVDVYALDKNDLNRGSCFYSFNIARYVYYNKKESGNADEMVLSYQ